MNHEKRGSEMTSKDIIKNDKKTVRIGIRITQDDYQKIKVECKRLHVTLSTFLYSLIQKEIK